MLLGPQKIKVRSVAARMRVCSATKQISVTQTGSYMLRLAPPLTHTCGGGNQHAHSSAKAVRIKPRRAAEAVSTVPDAGCPRVAAQLLTIRPGLAALHANQASIAARQCRLSHGNMRPARAVRD